MTTLQRLRKRLTDRAECREVGRVLQDYLDGELDDVRTSEVAAHLERCLRCGMEADVYAQIKLAFARRADSSDPHPEDQLAIERLRRFAAALAAPEG